MSFDPILDASPVIRLHVALALAALALGPVALWRRRRDGWHRAVGYAWTLSLAGLALSGLAIPSDGFNVVGRFGPIHLLSLWVLWTLWRAVGHARARRIALHREAMRSICFWAIGVAGLFTLVPGRVMGRTLFGDSEVAGWAAIGTGLALLVAAAIRRRRGAPRRPFRA